MTLKTKYALKCAIGNVVIQMAAYCMKQETQLYACVVSNNGKIFGKGLTGALISIGRLCDADIKFRQRVENQDYASAYLAIRSNIAGTYIALFSYTQTQNLDMYDCIECQFNMMKEKLGG
jgi:hypothetical protein